MYGERDVIVNRTNTNSARGGIGLPGALFLVFLALKLTGYIAWSWWWVTAPLWMPLALVLGIGAVVLVGWLLYKLFG